MSRSPSTHRAGRWLPLLLPLVALLVALAVPVPLQLRAVAVADSQRRDAADELASTQGRHRTVRAIVADASQDLRRLRGEVLVETGAGDAAALRTGLLAAEERRHREALVVERAELQRTSESLAWAEAVLGLQEHGMAALRECVAGVDRANDALSASDQRGAVAALDDATDACLRVRSGTRPPALPYDLPDPHVVRGPDGRWWGYATNSSAGAVQLFSSGDLARWELEGNALGALPAWASPGATWAPAAIPHGGRWLLYYTVRERSSGLQCISVATSASPRGPFHDGTAGPVICERSEGGSIDPNPVVDVDGRLHLLWKTELDTRGRPAELRGAVVDPATGGLAGPTATLLRASQPWEGRTIEAPAMVVDGGYHLLYSGSSWNTAGYAVGAARCRTVLGPCERQSPNPVLRSVDDRAGPGGLSVFDAGGRVGAAYHAWEADAVGYPHSRYLHVGSVEAGARGVTVQP